MEIIVDDKAVMKALTNAQVALKNTRPLYQAIQGEMIRDISDHFKDEQGPSGRWRGLKIETVINRARKRKNPSAGILKDSGLLRGSLLGQNQTTNKVTDQEARVGTTVKYAAIHNFGGRVQIPEIRPKNKKALRFLGGNGDVFSMRAKAHPVDIPKRPFMWMSDKAKKAMVDVISFAVGKAMK